MYMKEPGLETQRSIFAENLAKLINGANFNNGKNGFSITFTDANKAIRTLNIFKDSEGKYSIWKADTNNNILGARDIAIENVKFGFKENRDLLIEDVINTKIECSLSKDESVDYIYTDPPFGANIIYSEMKLLLEGWLKVKTNNGEEAIVDETANKTEFVSSEIPDLRPPLIPAIAMKERNENNVIKSIAQKTCWYSFISKRLFYRTH